MHLRVVDGPARSMSSRIALAVLLTLALAAGVVTGARAAEPAEATISPTAPKVSWEGRQYTKAEVQPGPEACQGQPEGSACDRFRLTVEAPAGFYSSDDDGVKVQIGWESLDDDFDLYVFDAQGRQVAKGVQSGTASDSVFVPRASGAYDILVVPYDVDENATSEGGSRPAGYLGIAELRAAAPLNGDFFFVQGADGPTFQADPPGDGQQGEQTASPGADNDVPGADGAAFFAGPFSGAIGTQVQLETYWSTLNPEAALLTGTDVVVTVFADPVLDGSAQPEKIIGRATLPIEIGLTPEKNLDVVEVNGLVKDNLLFQFAPVFSDSGQDNRISYGSQAAPSAFRQQPAEAETGNVTPDGVDGLASAPARGLKFSATVPADNQRDESEPLIEIDRDGVMYTCGPSGVSQGAEYAQVSTDGGDSFHLLGEPPRGQIGTGGGGDCSLATAPERNELGNFNLAYTGLGPLTNFTATRSPDNGRTLTSTPVSGETVPGVDRQWQTFLDTDSVLLSYNQQVPRQIVVQRADDGGINYGPRVPASPTNPSFPGPMRTLPAKFNPEGAEAGPVAYFPWNDGRQINFSLSTNGGRNWQMCTVAQSPGDPTLFTVADHDNAGNIYVVYGEDQGFHTYLTSLTARELAACNEPIAEQQSAGPTVDPGWSTPVQVDREGVRTTVFPWITAGGAPGRVAVTFYGTQTDGNPNAGSFKATWDVYVNQSLNANETGATFSQVKATTHPFHYDSICLEGLGCSVSGGDRSLADFFAIDYNEANGELAVVYDQGSKAPGDLEGKVATPAVVRQIAGPSLGGGTVGPTTREVVRTRSDDAVGDAQSNYSSLNSPPMPENQPAGDFLSKEVGPQVDLETGKPVGGDSGFTVTMRLGDLSDAALQQAMLDTQSQSLLWVFRFVDGYRASAASARYNPVDGFTFGYNEYTVANAQCGSNGDKCLQYPGNIDIEGDVDQETGTIRLNVGRELLSGLAGDTGPKQRPQEVPATSGTRFYDATAFSLGNPYSPTQEAQSFLYPLDNTPAMDFLLPGDQPSLAGRGPDGACDSDFVPTGRFDDVAGDTHRANINCIAWYLITLGQRGDNYAPQAKVSREQMASFLTRLAVEGGIDVPSNAPDAFGDDNRSVHEANINTLAALGLVEGTGERDDKDRERFAPDANVSRAQMATFIARIQKRVTGTLPEGEDAFGDDDGNVHEPSINALAALGIVKGVGDKDADGRDKFDPDGKVGRNQMATFIANELRLLARSDDVFTGGAEVFLRTADATSGRVEGRVSSAKRLQSLRASGCGLATAVTVDSQDRFTVDLPRGQSGTCVLTLTASTTNATQAVQRVAYRFTLTT